MRRRRLLLRRRRPAACERLVLREWIQGIFRVGVGPSGDVSVKSLGKVGHARG